MLELLQSVSLLALIITHAFLVRGCFSIKAELPIQGGQISTRLDRTADLLDEVAQLIADLSDGAPSQNVPVAQTGSPIGDLLTTFLNNRMSTAMHHATQSEEWEVLPPQDDTHPTTQDDQPFTGGATIPNR